MQKPEGHLDKNSSAIHKKLPPQRGVCVCVCVCVCVWGVGGGVRERGEDEAVRWGGYKPQPGED